MSAQLNGPFPYFGGQRTGAVLLARPGGPTGTETVNDPASVNRSNECFS